eukprot:CAMPEP_0177578532 /NCGR_PEP_ID=MMETSP0419_2-20121207/400_1 /TAXON_ID=582737 /ORGANISM="Tetraselmis sp., Strain GSL018" /LENGTH=55 /DNA_ID=CAMNT_0019066985 /DNA_START=737 /DNA_END=904 /DNA_ORIENTATION=-
MVRDAIVSRKIRMVTPPCLGASGPQLLTFVVVPSPPTDAEDKIQNAADIDVRILR